MKKIKIDFSKMIDFDRIHVFRDIPDEINHKGILLKSVIRRADAVVLHCNNSHDDPVHKASSIRAALSEFVSMEDVARRETDNKTLKIHETQDPLLIVLKELRNYDVHIGTSNISTNKRNLLWGNFNNIESAKEVNVEVDFIENLSWGELSKLRNISHYESPSDLEVCLDWVDFNQRQWGIDEIIYQATIRYIDYLERRFI